MSDLVNEICEVVSATLARCANAAELSSPITPESTMGDIKEWDSLNFVQVLVTVSAHFDIEIDDDEAIQFISIAGIHELIEEIRAES